MTSKLLIHFKFTNDFNYKSIKKFIYIIFNLIWSIFIFHFILLLSLIYFDLMELKNELKNEKLFITMRVIEFSLALSFLFESLILQNLMLSLFHSLFSVRVEAFLRHFIKLGWCQCWLVQFHIHKCHKCSVLNLYIQIFNLILAKLFVLTLGFSWYWFWTLLHYHFH